jgi:hypothetical protein
MTAPTERTETVAKVHWRNRILWLIMWVARIDLTPMEVQQRSYGSVPVPNQKFDKDQAKLVFELTEAGSDHTDDKVKQLLGLGSSLVTVIALFGGGVRPRALVVFTALMLLLSIVLCVSALEVRTRVVPTADPVNDEGEDNWARDLVQASASNRAFHAFRVDQYRAASRFFLAALLASAILALVARSDQSSGELNRTLQRIEAKGLLVRQVSQSGSSPAHGIPSTAAVSSTGSEDSAVVHHSISPEKLRRAPK